MKQGLDQIKRWAASLALALAVSVSAPAVGEAQQQQRPAEAVNQSRADLIAASGVYRESLERVLGLQQQDVARAAESVEKRKGLLDLGAISRRELEAGEQLLNAAQTRIEATRKRIAEADQLLAEIEVAAAGEVEEPVRMAAGRQTGIRTTGALMRYIGVSRWTLSDIGQVDAFFRLKFGRPLPVSALGQTETHDRLGFDHRAAIDVAVHPDGAEGQALIDHLRHEGISFIAIRQAIRGSATGAHIHIGQPSKRIALR